MEALLPQPVLPETAAWTPLLSRVIWLVASARLLLGVKVAVQVMPPSMVVTPLRVPLVMVRSALLKPVTASLKVMVTRDVPPIFNAGFATTTVAVGSTVSMVKLADWVVPEPALPARSLTPALARVMALVALLVFVAGVKVAVQVMPSALFKPLRLP